MTMHTPLPVPRLPPPLPGPSSLFTSPPSPHQPRHLPHHHSSHPPHAPPPPSLHRSESFALPSTSSASPKRPVHVRAQTMSAPGPGQGVGRLMDGSGASGLGDFGERLGAGPGADAAEAKDELTTKGRKRKRLAKACSACHKNKRRCDGFAPCSNCEFSSRPCLYLNAQGESIPPPRTRDSSAGDAASRRHSIAERPDDPHSLSSGHHAKKKRASWEAGSAERDGRREGEARVQRERERERERERWGEILEMADRDVAVQAELIELFLTRLHPYTTLLHPPTFQHRVYLSLNSPTLIDAICALAARLCPHPIFASLPPHLRGEPYALRAAQRLAVDRQRHFAVGSRSETEYCQSLVLLAAYYSSMGAPDKARYHLDLALALFRPPIAPPQQTDGMGDAERKTFEEVRWRTWWVAVMQDCVLAASGTTGRRRTGDRELIVGMGGREVGGEVGWVRFGGMARQMRGGGEGEVGEMGWLIRIMIIFSDIMQVVNAVPPASPGTRTNAAAVSEQALKNWAMSLPPHLHFSTPTLHTHLAHLAHPLPQIASSAWAFCMMHAIAESGMFYLQAALASGPGGSIAAQRQGGAVENIGVILDGMGERGRESPFTLLPLQVITNWQDHLMSTVPHSQAVSHPVSQKLDQWWGELQLVWGIPRPIQTPPPPAPPSSQPYNLPPPQTTSSLSMSLSSTSPTLSTTFPPPQSQSQSQGLGLYTSPPPPPGTGMTSASRPPLSSTLSTTSSSNMTLPTPILPSVSAGRHHRFSFPGTGSGPALPPLQTQTPRWWGGGGGGGGTSELKSLQEEREEWLQTQRERDREIQEKRRGPVDHAEEGGADGGEREASHTPGSSSWSGSARIGRGQAARGGDDRWSTTSPVSGREDGERDRDGDRGREEDGDGDERLREKGGLGILLTAVEERRRREGSS